LEAKNLEKTQPENRIVILKENFEKIDQKIAFTMDKYGIGLLRISLGFIFIWFGILKPLGVSSAEGLANQLVEVGAWWIPGNEYFYNLIAIIEILIGVFFLFNRTLRLAILLLFIQMPLTILPLFLLPEVTWQIFLIAPTIEGQYIIKNVVLISAAIVIGGTVRKLK
jgi:uncharacterized membrane protein YkgB